MKKEYTVADIMDAAPISRTMFYHFKKRGVIPPADDRKRMPHIWYYETIKPFLESRKKK